MAAGTQLKMIFETGYGEKTWTFKYAKPAATAANIKELGNTMIANGSIYHYPPLQLVKAQLETTTGTTVDVS